MKLEDQPAFSTVPTLEQLGGNFSFNGLGFPVYDPASTIQDATGRWVRSQFPGNIIPRSRFDPVATKFLSYQPWYEPNNLGGAGFIDRTGPHNNFGGFTKTRSYRTSWDAKVDHIFSEKNRLFARYSHVRNRAQNGNQSALKWELLDGNWVQQPSDQFNVVTSDTHVFRPNVINEVRVGTTHRKQSRNLDVRFDIQNPFKRPNFANPVSTANITNPGTFWKPTCGFMLTGRVDLERL